MKLGDEQFAKAAEWEAAGRLALVGIGVEPGLSDVFARYAADHLFSEIDELGTRDGANLEVLDDEGNRSSRRRSRSGRRSRSASTRRWCGRRTRGWFTTAPFSEPEVFDFPEGIGPVECVNVEHEEVLLMPRWVDASGPRSSTASATSSSACSRRCTRSASTAPRRCRVGGVEVSPARRRRRLPARPGRRSATRMRGKTCAGLQVTGTGKDGQPRSTYLYHVVDNEWSMREYGHQCVVWQTAVNPVVALELLANGTWSGAGVLGPGGVRRRAVPRPAHRVRLPLGPAGRLVP